MSRVEITTPGPGIPPLDPRELPAWVNWTLHGPIKEAMRSKDAAAIPEPSQGFKVEFTSKAVADAEDKLREVGRRLGMLQAEYGENEQAAQKTMDPDLMVGHEARNRIISTRLMPGREAEQTRAHAALNEARAIEAAENVAALNAELEVAEHDALMLVCAAVQLHNESREVHNRASLWHGHTNGSSPSVHGRIAYQAADIIHDVWRDPSPLAVARFLKMVFTRFGLEVEDA